MISKNNSSGFTLFELVLVIFIIGLMLMAVLAAVSTTQERLRVNETNQRIEFIADALSGFASRNLRLPCPAGPDPATEPFGAEAGSGPDGTDIGTCSGMKTEGLVPFFALGLDDSEARDGWGNYFTYQVSEAYTLDPEKTSTIVHAKCRTSTWINGGRNMNPLKARFCCNGEEISEDTRICASPDNPCSSFIWPFPRSASNYEVADTLATVASHFEPKENHLAVAYALISHGSNGTGAFLANGTSNRVPGSAGTYEILNADNTQSVVWSLPNNKSSNANYFDDVVRWQTQAQILAKLGRDSCAVP